MASNPEVIVETMAAYLQRVQTAGEEHQQQIRYGTPDYVADYLIASLADNLGFTEHGGGIGGSWLTESGTRWLELWRIAIPSPVPSREAKKP